MSMYSLVAVEASTVLAIAFLPRMSRPRVCSDRIWRFMMNTFGSFPHLSVLRVAPRSSIDSIVRSTVARSSLCLARRLFKTGICHLENGMRGSRIHLSVVT